MSDDKSKRGQSDRSKVAGGEAYEVDYLARQIQPLVPNKSRAEVEAAIVEATKVKEFHNNREMVKNAALGKLGKLPWQ
jgi:hypothetical protein